MAVQIDDLGGKVLRSKIENLGVKVHTQKATSSIEDGANAKHVMKLGIVTGKQIGRAHV